MTAASALLAAALLAQAASNGAPQPCVRPLAVEVGAPTEAALRAQEIARGVRRTGAWRLAGAEPALGALTALRHGEGVARTADGTELRWRPGPPPGDFRLVCRGEAMRAAGEAAPPEPADVPRIRGYRYAGSQPMRGAAFGSVGIWRAVDGPAESLIVVFDPRVRTLRAEYAVLVRTPLPLAAVSATAPERALEISLAAVTSAAPGAPTYLFEYSWRDGSAYSLKLD